MLALALAERERRRRAVLPLRLTPPEFTARTQIEVAQGAEATLAPFALWPAQADVLTQMERERLLVILKARQLGISWLACAYALWLCVQRPHQTVLLFSQGQLEANELIRRIGLLYTQHQDRARLPALRTDNTAELGWVNGSRVLSLAATRRAGRSFTASLVILDEFAFMQWGAEVLGAVKPTVDAGGQLFIISSADGAGTPYHQFWQAAAAGANGYRAIFLPWSARPERDAAWRDAKLVESGGDTTTIAREYPSNDLEAFTAAAGLVYDTWSDGPPDGNVTEQADYIAGAGPVLWGVDDGYSGQLDAKTGQFTAQSHPRVFLLAQQRPDGTLCIFAESYAVKELSDKHIADVLALPYELPEYAAVDSSAAELRGRLHEADVATKKATHTVDEGIKETRRRLAADGNGRRSVLVHPHCKYLRAELASYRVDPATGKPIKAFDHGADCLRYLCWATRYDQ